MQTTECKTLNDSQGCQLERDVILHVEASSLVESLPFCNFVSFLGPVLETEASSPNNYENAPSSCSTSGEDLHRQVS